MARGKDMKTSLKHPIVVALPVSVSTTMAEEAHLFILFGQSNMARMKPASKCCTTETPSSPTPVSW